MQEPTEKPLKELFDVLNPHNMSLAVEILFGVLGGIYQ